MFSVGEIAIVAGPFNHHEYDKYIGTEVTILGPIEVCPVDGSSAHRITPLENDGRTWWAEPRQLRKKPPYDGNVKTTWDDLIVWKPKEVVTV